MISTATAASQDQSVFFAAQEHVGVVMLIAGLFFMFIIFLLAERGRTKRLYEEKEEKYDDDKLARLEKLVAQQSTAMESVATDMKNIISTLQNELKIMSETIHTRITELSREFYHMKGEHDHNMQMCPALQSMKSRPNPGRRAYDPAQFVGVALTDAKSKYNLSFAGRENSEFLDEDQS